MITIDGKNYRNLEEQVLYNKDRLDNLIAAKGVLDEFGIKVVGQVLQMSQVPTVAKYKEYFPDWEYGDTYAVGSEQPYKLYILTRAYGEYTEDHWFYIGEFPAPGPEGKAGKDGVDGTNGTNGTTPAITATASVSNTVGTPVVTVTKSGTTANPNFYFNFQNIKGEKGETGATGNTGETGKQGPVGPAFNVYGTVTSTSQLPTATAELQDKGAAYLIPIDGVNHLYLIQYDNTDSSTPMWVDVGPAGVQGQQGEQGEDGFGFGNTTIIQANAVTKTSYTPTSGATVLGTWTVVDAATSKVVNQQAGYQLPLIDGSEVTFTTSGNYLKPTLAEELSGHTIQNPTLSGIITLPPEAVDIEAWNGSDVTYMNADDGYRMMEFKVNEGKFTITVDPVYIKFRTVDENDNDSDVPAGKVLATTADGVEWTSLPALPEIPVIAEDPYISYTTDEVNWDEYYSDDFVAAALKTGMIKVGPGQASYSKIYHLDEVETNGSAYYICRQKDSSDPYIMQSTISVDVVNKRIRKNVELWANNIE